MPYKNDSDKTLYLDAGKTRIVEEGGDAAYVLAGPGGEVSDADAVKYGLMDKPEADPNAPRAASRVESLQSAHDAAMERGATEEARVHRANLEAAHAEESHAADQDAAAPRRTAAGASPRSAAQAGPSAPAEGGRTVPRQAKGE